MGFLVNGCSLSSSVLPLGVTIVGVEQSVSKSCLRTLGVLFLVIITAVDVFQSTLLTTG